MADDCRDNAGTITGRAGGHRSETDSQSPAAIRSSDDAARLTSRRNLLKSAAALAGGALFAGALSETLPAAPLRRALAARFPQAAAGTLSALDATRAQMGAIPITSTKLGDNLTLFAGPGGNVVALHGPDGKIVVDCFVQPAWPKFKQALDGLGGMPIKMLIDSHWHFDHTDNNAAMHAAGASILAHTNTKKRLTETHDLLGMHFVPVPASALPSETFEALHMLSANGEDVMLGHIAPAHTDSDIYIQFRKANVIHMADVFFNGMYPFFDIGTGGNIKGMIAGANRGLSMSDAKTKIVPGHGPLGDKAALAKCRDLMVIVHDRVKKLKDGGKSLDEVVAAKPTSEYDAAWGHGFLTPEQFIGNVYATA